MTWPVLIRAAAEKDLDEARKWYDRHKPGLGDEFLVRIAEASARLEQNPERYRVLYKGFRRVLVERFPYRIFYYFSSFALTISLTRVFCFEGLKRIISGNLGWDCGSVVL